MKYNNPLEIANITTDVLADYLYKAISDLDSEEDEKKDKTTIQIKSPDHGA